MVDSDLVSFLIVFEQEFGRVLYLHVSTCKFVVVCEGPLIENKEQRMDGGRG